VSFETLTDAIEATRAVLLDSADVGQLVAGRVYGAELPGGDAGSMPRAAVVVGVAGTPSLRPGTRDYIGWSKRRVDIRCYGQSFQQAMRVAAAVDAHLKEWERRGINGVLVDSFTHTAGPIQFRDADTDWPLVVTTWNVLYADRLVQ
jgi:hypothetical protein